MALYVDDACIIDTDFLVAVTLFDGVGSLDGTYFLEVLLAVGGKPRRMVVRYDAKHARHAAFRALCDVVRAAEAAQYHEDEEETL